MAHLASTSARCLIPAIPGSCVGSPTRDDWAGPFRLLWIDDEVRPGDALVRLLANEGLSVDVAGSGRQGLGMAEAEVYHSILLDLKLPDLFGLTVLERLVARGITAPILVASAYYLEPELEASALRIGAKGFLQKPFCDAADLARVLRQSHAPAMPPVRAHRPAPPASDEPLPGIIAVSPPMRAIVKWIHRVAGGGATVLLTGETGTGKELVAGALHRAGARRDGPFVAVNCGAVPEGLIESELFGRRKGTFTGAHDDRIGLFEAAHGGTLFLDEIGDLPLAMQVRLLRCLENGEVRRLGETHTRRVDVRVVAATNRSLPAAIECGQFRADLYYRLAVATCHIPALRERPDDIGPLVTYLLTRMPAMEPGACAVASPEALALLCAHSWPGNIRELRNVLERSVYNASGAVLTAPDVAAALIPDTPPAAASSVASAADLAALERHHWNHTRAARSLGISRSTLWRRLRRESRGRTD
jgi:two-component system, NtrC family, response regulator AtoC